MSQILALSFAAAPAVIVSLESYLLFG